LSGRMPAPATHASAVLAASPMPLSRDPANMAALRNCNLIGQHQP